MRISIRIETETQWLRDLFGLSDQSVLKLSLSSSQNSQEVSIPFAGIEEIEFDALGDSEVVFETDIPDNFGDINQVSIDWDSLFHPENESIKRIYIKELVDAGKNYDTGNIQHTESNVIPITSTTQGANDYIDGIYFNVWRKSNTANQTSVGTFSGNFDTSGTFNPDGKTYVLIHGWVNSGGNPDNGFLPSEPGMQMLTKYLLENIESQDNVIWVDWSNYSGYELERGTLTRSLNYPEASQSLARNSQIIKGYLETLGFNNQEALNKLTIMGFSLGAQTAGLTGKLYKKDSLDVEEVYLFDPAGPIFEQAYAEFNQTDPENYQPFYADAGKNVYAFHSSKDTGYDFPIGDRDIYINAYNYNNPTVFLNPQQQNIPYGGDFVSADLENGIPLTTFGLLYFRGDVNDKQEQDAKYGIDYNLLEIAQWPASGPLFYRQPRDIGPGPVTPQKEDRYLGIATPDPWGLGSHGYGPAFFAKVLADQPVIDLNTNSNTPNLNVTWDEIRNPDNYVTDSATNSQVWFINEETLSNASTNSATYKVTTKVANIDWRRRDGTEKKVFLTLKGTLYDGTSYSSDPINLRDFYYPLDETQTSNNPFARGVESNFIIESQDFSEITSVVINVQDANRDYLQIDDIAVEKVSNVNTVPLFELKNLSRINEQSIFGNTSFSSYPASREYVNILQGDNAFIDGVWFHVLDENGERTPISDAELDPNQPTYFIIHGFTAGRGDAWFYDNLQYLNNQDYKLGRNDWKRWQAFNSTQHGIGLTVQAYNPDANVVIVDWGNFDGPLDSTPIYTAPALFGTERTANALADYILTQGLNPENITLVGHSLGGHVAGKTGQRIKQDIAQGLYADNVSSLGTIIGMDTAGPIFQSLLPSQRLSADDAINVYNLHTSANFGYDGPLAQYDLYINTSSLSINQTTLGELVISESTSAKYNHSGFSRGPLGANDHSYAQALTALMFAESVPSFQTQPGETFDDVFNRKEQADFFLFNDSVSANFYNDAWGLWREPLDIVQETNYEFSSEVQFPLTIENLFDKDLFSDEYFKWNFDTTSKFSDNAGFWYDKNYTDERQSEPINLAVSPDTKSYYDLNDPSLLVATTTIAELALVYPVKAFVSLYNLAISAFSGPLTGGEIWFDQRNTDGELNLTLDPSETPTTVGNDGQFTLPLTEEQNTYQDVSRGLWNGESFINFTEQVIDFRDGVIVATSGDGNAMLDSITGEDYGIPFIGLPGGNISIVTTLKYSPVLLWNDAPQNINWTDNQRYYERLTPEAFNQTFSNNWANIPDQLLDDNYNPYTELGQGNADKAADALTYQYQLLALVQITKRLMTALEVDRDNWGRELSASPVESEGFLAIRSFHFLFQVISGNADEYYTQLWNDSGYDWTSLDPTNAQQVTEAWTYILNTHATKLGEEQSFFGADGKPLNPGEVQQKVEALPLEWIAEALTRGQRQLEVIIRDAGLKGTNLIIPAIAGVKQRFLQNDSQGLLYQLVDLALESGSKAEYDAKTEEIFVRNDYYTNYVSSETDSALGIISLTTDSSASVENIVLDSANEVERYFQIELSRPAPVYGLTVRYVLGGDAVEGEDYQIEETGYGSFYIAPGETSYRLNLAVRGDAINGESDSVQLRLLNADSGFAISAEKNLASYLISAEPHAWGGISFAPSYSAMGDAGDNVLSVPDSAVNPVFVGGEGADEFIFNPQVKGVTYFQEFDPSQGDKILVNQTDFPAAVPGDFTIYSGTLFYQNQPLALVGNVVEGSEQAYSVLTSRGNVKIRKSIVFGTGADDTLTLTSSETGSMVFSGSGNDTIEASLASAVKVEAGAGDDTIFLGSDSYGNGDIGADTLYVGSQGAASGSVLNGGAGEDTLMVLEGGNANILLGAADNDNLQVAEGSGQLLFGGSGGDELRSSDQGGNRLYGGSGDDQLYSTVSDRLFGGAGSDSLYAGVGGDNSLWGGDGADNFWLVIGGSLPDSPNMVNDFAVGSDRIGISGITANQVSLVAQGNNTVIKVDGTDVAVFTGVNPSQLDVTNSQQFIFV